MVTPIIKDKGRDKEGKLDFASDATFATLIAGSVNTSALITLLSNEYSSIIHAFGSTIWNAGELFLLGVFGFSVGGLILRILIYFIYHSNLDANEKTARTMAGGSFIFIITLLSHFYYFPSYLPNDYQIFALYVIPMLLAYNAYVWYWNIWDASNDYFRGIENVKRIVKKSFY